MRAAVLHEIPGVLQIDDLKTDKPSANEVLIQTTHAGLCHSDLHFMEGLWQTGLPCVMGHESAGIVQAVGSDVSYVKPGDHVISCLSVFCGQCNHCLTGHPNRCANHNATARSEGGGSRIQTQDGQAVDQFARLGGFAEEMLVHQNAIVKVREDMPLDRAALIGCGVTTGVGAVFKTARIEPGSVCAVIGAGGIGLSAIQGCRIAGAGRTIAIDISDAKLEIARQMGATDTINAAEVDPVQAVMEMTGGGVDYSFEAIGRKQTYEQAFGMVATGGTAVMIGMLPFGETIEVPGFLIAMQEKSIKGSMMGSNAFRVDMPRYVDMYLDGRLMLDEMISGVIALEDINEGYEWMKRGEATRTVVDFNR
ncbi:MAG: Zn-dependent alcohol dehydrogenase [Actinomycetia bacterium]|nr:Zn-dependent alcohol dehydrogenase [Actinomycetes bacterium]MCP4963145.1 Zn-dependent alcohol dehydrogenase [Actinomycetes bacterium]